MKLVVFRCWWYIGCVKSSCRSIDDKLNYPVVVLLLLLVLTNKTKILNTDSSRKQDYQLGGVIGAIRHEHLSQFWRQRRWWGLSSPLVLGPASYEYN